MSVLRFFSAGLTVAAIVIFIVCPPAAQGGLVTFRFEGQISESDSAHVSVGDRFIGAFTFDTDAEDLAEETDTGSYEFPLPDAAPAGMTYTVGTVSYDTLSGSELLIFDNSFTFDDWFLFTSDSFADPSPPQRGEILLEDITQTALSSDRPPASLTLADFSDAFFFGVDAEGDNFSGTIDALNVVPEPASQWFAMTSLLFWGRSRKRKTSRPQKRRTRIRLEPLESRALLSLTAPMILPGVAAAEAVGDFNGDGREDILTNGSMLLGQADGGFQSIPKTASGGVTGDFNQDGNLDVLALNFETIQVYLGRGDGTFRAGQQFALPAVGKGRKADPQTTNSAATGDLNGDGHLDLVVTGDGQQIGGACGFCPPTTKTYVNVFVGRGDGTFHTPGETKTKGTKTGGNASTVLLGEGAMNTSPVVLSDFNADGKLDVLAADPQVGDVPILLLKGDGVGKLGKPTTVFKSPWPTFQLAAQDLNDDGKLDVITHPDNAIRVHLGNGNGTFQSPADFDASGQPWDFVLADFNRDGTLDVATANPETETISVLVGNANGTFQPAKTFATGPAPTALFGGDFNGDGNVDLVVNHHVFLGGNQAPSPAVLWNDGNWSSFAAARGFVSESHDDSQAINDGDEPVPSNLTIASHGEKSVPNDKRLNQQWALEVTEAERAWELTIGSTQIIVAVNDSGVEYTHPDLYKNIWINQDEIPIAIRSQLQDVDGDALITFWDLNEPVNQGPGKITDLNGTGFIDGGDLLLAWVDGQDNGANGYVDDLIGWDFVNDDNDPMETARHGTLVAGVIGAVGDNGIGVAGVNWKVQIMPLVRGGPGATVQDSLDALYYAVDNGARVSNHSYGVRPSTLTEAELAAGNAAFEYAAAIGHLVVASAMNDSSDNDIFPRLPASYDLPNIISVAATDKQDRLAKFTNFGVESVDLGAPGARVATTDLGGKYAIVDGTSFAAPHVAGAAALILARNPDLNYAEVKALILDNVDPIDELNGITVSGGRLNIHRAIAATPLPSTLSSNVLITSDIQNRIAEFRLVDVLPARNEFHTDSVRDMYPGVDSDPSTHLLAQQSLINRVPSKAGYSSDRSRDLSLSEFNWTLGIDEELLDAIVG